VANKRQKAIRKLAHKAAKAGQESIVFRGKPCITSFSRRDENPMNKRTSPWRGAKLNPSHEWNW
jgi:hypothetical protein